MNIYVVVEGEIGEKKVYANWIPLVNNSLSPVTYLNEIDKNNFYIISGNGYPNYFKTIENAVYDVYSNDNIDRLVIAIDSENYNYTDKYREVNDFIQSLGIDIEYKIIVQHFCLETWALGNKNIYVRRPQSDELRYYQSIYNVSENDPEDLPDLAHKGLNRAQFSERYLRTTLNEKYRNLTYSKKNPNALLHHKFFESIRSRNQTDGHLSSFSNFLSAFV